MVTSSIGARENIKKPVNVTKKKKSHPSLGVGGRAFSKTNGKKRKEAVKQVWRKWGDV